MPFAGPVGMLRSASLFGFTKGAFQAVTPEPQALRQLSSSSSIPGRNIISLVIVVVLSSHLRLFRN